MAVKTLLCRMCNKNMPLDTFPKRYQSGDYLGRSPICQSCDSERLSDWRSSGQRNFLSTRYGDAKRRARRVGIPIKDDFTLDLLLRLYKDQDGRCAVSKLPMTWAVETEKGSGHHARRGTNISIDRIDSSKGYEKKNIRLVCEKVNQIKSSMSDADLYFWSAQISGSMSGFPLDESD